MKIDQQLIEEWGRQAAVNADAPAGDIEYDLGPVITALLAERDGLLTRIDALLHGTPERRWNVTQGDGDRLLVCRGDHDRAQDCEREAFVPAARLDEALAVLREAEWARPGGVDGCLDLCPSCRGRQRDGHAPNCRLAALIGGAAQERRAEPLGLGETVTPAKPGGKDDR